MNPISSSDFRNQNNILFNAKIINGLDNLRDCHITNGEYDGFLSDVGMFDVIDVDHSGSTRHSINTSGFLPVKSHIKTKEPVLELPFGKIKEAAERRDTEVVTQEDAPNLRACDVELTGKMFTGTGRKTNYRSLDQVASEIDPFGAKWAIDVKEGEYILYTPKK